MFKFLSVLSLTIMLVSCGSSKPTHFYLLNDVQLHHMKTVQGVNNIVIGIGPVNFPKYLNQPQIVTRSGSNKMNIDEFNQWGEPLENNFTQVLGKNLQKILNSNNVVVYPWDLSQKINFQIIVEVYRFEATTDGKVIGELNYKIINPQTREQLIAVSKTYREIIPQKFSYTQLAASMSRIVGRISEDMAKALIFQ